jgi:trehalose 6-phosphate phosphatase
VHDAGIALLARLRDRLDGAMAILSGRSLEQVDAILSPLKLTAAGVHGAQLRRTSDAIETFVPAEWARTQVEQACRSVALPQGVWLETKAALSFAFHFRAAPGRATWVAQQARSIAARTGGAYVVQFGDGVAEVRPANADQGTALLSLMQSPAFIGRLPVVIGDDLTDEAAFREARLWEGTSVLVGERSPTHATYRLESPAAVHDWLASLLHRLERREGTPVA